MIPCGGRRWAERRALPHRRAPQGGSRVRPRAPGAGGPRVPSPLRPGLPGSGPASLSRRGRGEALRAESPAERRGILLLFSGRVPSCYSNQDLDYPVLESSLQTAFYARGTASYLLLCRSSGVWGRGCSALHFPSAPIRQVSCNTLLGGFRLLWPPSCCLDRRTSFGLCAPLAPRNAA